MLAGLGRTLRDGITHGDVMTMMEVDLTGDD